ncbi:MAG: hypothetical protein LBV79_01810, partial [Candidatus Adiutrix sp.]|nr:hypothetical protein [Candidatus Adiutrix sp.]
IPLLAHHFLEKYSTAQKKDVRKLSAYALDILSRYHFPGNIRELENIIERSVALEQSNIILPESLRLADFKRNVAEPPPAPPSFGQPLYGGAPPAPLAWPKAAAPGRGFAETAVLPSLPPGGIDDLLAGLEVYYLYRALAASGNARGRTATALTISPWRLRARLVAYELADLSAGKLASLGPDRFPKPDLPQGLAPDWTATELNLDEILLAVERHFIHEALTTGGGNKTEAASLLGLSRRSFQHRLDKTNYEAWEVSQLNV